MPNEKPIDAKKVTEAGRIVAVAAREYVNGKISLDKFNGILAKAQRIPGFLDMYDIESLKEDRAAKYSTSLDNAQLLKLTGAWWKAVKKEAGIKSAGLFKSDAKVSKHIDRFQASVQAWRKSRPAPDTLGDPGKLKTAIKEGEALKLAFAEFIKKKEFVSDLAKQLRDKITKFDRDLTQVLKEEKEILQVYVKYTTAKKNELVTTLKKSGLPF